MEEQLKRLEDHYYPLINSSKTPEDTQAVKITFLRELLLYTKDLMNEKKSNRALVSKVLDHLITLVKRDGKGQITKKLPIDISLITSLAMTIETSTRRYNEWKAVQLFYILILDYPKLVANVPQLTKTMSQIILLRMNENENVFSMEYFERILSFYSSYCLEFHDQNKIFQQNINELFPSLMESLSRPNGNTTIASKALQSLFITSLAKDMCQTMYEKVTPDDGPA